jgi:hypothetical protein
MTLRKQTFTNMTSDKTCASSNDYSHKVAKNRCNYSNLPFDCKEK